MLQCLDKTSNCHSVNFPLVLDDTPCEYNSTVGVKIFKKKSSVNIFFNNLRNV
jgi:hypothetical protein